MGASEQVCVSFDLATGRWAQVAGFQVPAVLKTIHNRENVIHPARAEVVMALGRGFVSGLVEAIPINKGQSFHCPIVGGT
eukprot:scaffold1352_cov144-Cylindrotheca_fusiformis.AAC.4